MHPGVVAAVESIQIIASSEPLPSQSPLVPGTCGRPSTTTGPPSGTLPSASDSCAHFRYVAGLPRRTHPFYFGGDVKPASAGSPDVTLATQLTVDRLTTLERLLANWNGPASVALHVRDAELETITDRIQSSPVQRGRTNVAIHVVYRRLVLLLLFFF